MGADGRISTVKEQIDGILASGEWPSAKVWNRTKPEWVPSASAFSNSIGTGWITVCIGMGAKPKQTQINHPSIETECECGRPIETLRHAVILLGYENETDTVIPMCNQCAKIWDEDQKG